MVCSMEAILHIVSETSFCDVIVYIRGHLPIAREVAVVGSSVKTRARTTNVTRAGSDVFVLAVDIDELVLLVEGNARIKATAVGLALGKTERILLALLEELASHLEGNGVVHHSWHGSGSAKSSRQDSSRLHLEKIGDLFEMWL